MLFCLGRNACKLSVRFEEFRLRISPLRPQRKFFANHSDDSRANSLVGSFVVRLRDGQEYREYRCRNYALSSSLASSRRFCTQLKWPPDPAVMQHCE
jgi:hypothetical protein